MSWPAVAWAMAQRAPSSPCKFLLVTLADTASAGDWLAWPSVAYMSDTTQQDRKTVLCNLKRLEAVALIAAAGRTGKTGQVTVWRLPVVVHGKSPKNGTLADTETVPNFLANSTVFPLKESQKRDTEPVLNLLGTKGEGEQVAQPTPEAPTAKGKKARTSSPELTYAEWATDCRARGEPLFSDWQPFTKWFETTGLDSDWVKLWCRAFEAKQANEEAPKKQRNWRKKVLQALREDWAPHLWRYDQRNGVYRLTNAGVLAAREFGMSHLVSEQTDIDWSAVR